MMFHPRNQGESWYDTAQICLNGHVIVEGVKTSPALKRAFCHECGAATITECPKCGANIRGYYHVPGVISLGRHYRVPKFCSDCGFPYPWTESSLKAAHELANEITGISEGDRNILMQSLDELVRDTPQAEVAALRFKKIAPKLGKEVADVFRRILIDIASETAKKLIWPS